MNRRGIIGFILGPIFKWFALGVGFVFVIAWAITLANVKTSDLAVTGVSDVNLEGLTLDATLTVENGGLLPVQIESVPYTVTLDATNATLAEGVVEGFTLGSGESEAIPLTIELAWSGTGMTAVELLTEESVPATIEAQVRVQPIYVLTIPITVKQRVDLANYTAERTGTGILDAARDVVQTTGLGTILDGLRN